MTSPKYKKLTVDKLHYIYREFTTNYFDVDLSSMPNGATSFNFRNFYSHIMGLCLTYNVNCGSITTRTPTHMLNF